MADSIFPMKRISGSGMLEYQQMSLLSVMIRDLSDVSRLSVHEKRAVSMPTCVSMRLTRIGIASVNTTDMSGLRRPALSVGRKSRKKNNLTIVQL